MGDVSMFVAALGAAGAALTMIVNQAGMAYQAVLTFRSYTDIVAEGPDLALPADPAPARALRRGIEFDNVWFRYSPDLPWILRGVSFFGTHGQAVGVVGRNGAGKSTLVKLMRRFYDRIRGRILWDGTDLRDMDVAGLRDRISVVFQDDMVYELSARGEHRGRRFSQRQEPDALAAAARLAGIDGALDRAAQGRRDAAHPHLCGPGRQGGSADRRAAVRRAVAARRAGPGLPARRPGPGDPRRAKFRLDAEAEYEIHSGLRAHRHGRTSVLISHRLNAIRDADHIVVLVDGTVVEQGDHHALMARSGTYARLFSLQAKGFADDTAPAHAMSVTAEGTSVE